MGEWRYLHDTDSWEEPEARESLVSKTFGWWVWGTPTDRQFNGVGHKKRKATEGEAQAWRMLHTKSGFDTTLADPARVVEFWPTGTSRRKIQVGEIQIPDLYSLAQHLKTVKGKERFGHLVEETWRLAHALRLALGGQRKPTVKQEHHHG